MSSFVIKIIAIISMVFDHAGYAIYGKISWFNYIGRLSFPLFAFQTSIGYQHTKNLKKYYFRMILLAVISQIPLLMLYSVFANTCPLNVFFTLILGLSALTIYDKSNNKTIGLLGVLSMAYLAHFLNTDYGMYGYGVICIFLFYIFKNNHIFLLISHSIITILYFINPLLLTHFRTDVIIFTLLTILPASIVFFYNNKKGKNVQHIFYWFYPIHLVILYFMNIFIFNTNPNHIENIHNTINFIITNIRII